MPLIVSDVAVFIDANGLARPYANQPVQAEPGNWPFFEYNGGRWYEVQNLERNTLTDGTGLWSVALPFPSVSDPNPTTWRLELPDGTIWSGVPPEGISGPLTPRQLTHTYGGSPWNWGLVSTGVAPGPVTAIQGIPGVTGAPATTSAVGTVLLAGTATGGTGNALIGNSTDVQAGALILGATGPTSTPFILRGATQQTADLLDIQDSGQTTQLGFANVGTGAAPIWVLRIAGTSGTPALVSLAQPHVLAQYTGFGIPVYCSDNTFMGFLPLHK